MFLCCLNNFRNLKHVNLTFEGQFNTNVIRSIYFKNCQLKSLSLTIYPFIDAYFFEFLPENFPELNYLYLKSLKIDKTIVNNFRRMSNLRTIELFLSETTSFHLYKDQLRNLYNQTKLEFIKLDENLL